MSILIAGGSQLYTRDLWRSTLASPLHHVGNLINAEDLQNLTRIVDLEISFDYRNSVGRQTRSIVNTLGADEFANKVIPERLIQLVEDSAVLPEADGLLSC